MDSCKSGVIRVYVVEDHPVVREGIAGFLARTEDIKVVGMTDSLAVAFPEILAVLPDVVLTDIRLGDANGFTLARRLKEEKGDAVKVIVFTSYDDAEYIAQAIRIHVDGFLLKSSSSEYLLEAIRIVHSGGHFLSPEISGKVLEESFLLNRDEHHRQKNEDIVILSGLAQGMTTAQLCERLHLSDSTVKRRIKEIFELLGVNTRAQAVAEAYKRGLL